MARKTSRRTPARRRQKTQTPAPAKTLPHEDANLTVAQYHFCLSYLANGFNARAAYLSAHPDVTLGTAGVEGHRSLNNPKIREFIKSRLDDIWKPLHMTDNEVLARVAREARSDVRLLFNEQGELLKPHEWPDDIAGVIDAVDMGNGKVKLVPKLQAQRTILEVSGRLKTSATEAVDELAKLMKADIERSRKSGVAPNP
jgi:phage terminase small subunit